MKQSSKAVGTYLEGTLAAAALVGLYVISVDNYLLFHAVVEMFSIIVACAIFVVFWNTRRFVQGGYFLLIGVAYLAVGALDLMHTLAYKGMGVFPGYGANLATQLWIAARYVQSLSLLAAGLFLDRSLRPGWVLSVYVLVVVLLLFSIFAWPVFPTCYIEGQGLTPFKRVSEYLIAVFLVAAIGILFRRRRRFDRSVYRLLVWSLFLTIGAELAFTVYVGVYGVPNLIGHCLKLLSFYLMYKALVEVSLTQPYELLFRNLKTSEEQLRVYSEQLEEMVAERTEALREAQEQLVRREKLAVMGQMAGSVGHELRNPLGAIMSASYYLNQVLVDPEQDVAKVLEIIDREAQSAAKITHDLLDFARTNKARREAVSACELVETALGRASVPERVRVEVDMPSSLPELWVDPEQIGRQVLVNLIVNAYQAMPEGGDLVIGAQASSEERTRPAAVAIRVQDTGCGIAPKDLDKLFEPLFTTKARGIGLGLAVVKHLVDLNSGRIEVGSTVGKGTTFTVYLPVAGEEG